jgi:hypothetical protein
MSLMVRFITLSEALAYIESALAPGDVERLAAASRRPLPAAWVLDRLREYNQLTSISRLYAAREFPRDTNKFKLGGHSSELGHIHIDFTTKGDGWELEEIWMCR